MMEFTYNDLVRAGFGFYNPNHAAALICALFPLVWHWWRSGRNPWAHAGLITVNVLLLAALVMTCSRTGMVLLLAEVIYYFKLYHFRRWLLVLGVAAALLLSLYCYGSLERFVFDRALGNRFYIYLAGVKIFAANPGGVGWGNSGLAAAWLLSDQHIVCRTLVNSHLTLLVESGILAGWLWLTFVFCALSGQGRAVRTAFAALALSAVSASVFDWGVLFDFDGLGGLTKLNFILSWGVLLLFAGLGIKLVLPVNPKRWLISGTVSAGVLATMLLFYQGGTPTVKDGYLIRPGKETVMILYSGDYDFYRALKHAGDGGFIIPLRPLASYKPNLLPFEHVILLGNAAEFAPAFAGNKVTLVDCPEIYRR